jgi:hypothetical protein
MFPDRQPVCTGFVECWWWSAGNLFEVVAIVGPWLLALFLVIGAVAYLASITGKSK